MKIFIIKCWRNTCSIQTDTNNHKGERGEWKREGGGGREGKEERGKEGRKGRKGRKVEEAAAAHSALLALT